MIGLGHAFSRKFDDIEFRCGLGPIFLWELLQAPIPKTYQVNKMLNSKAHYMAISGTGVLLSISIILRCTERCKSCLLCCHILDSYLLILLSHALEMGPIFQY